MFPPEPNHGPHPAGNDAVGIAVDRVACTGHGACAALLPSSITLDPWGYPVLADVPVDRKEAHQAITLCPARALYLDPPRSIRQ